MIYFTSIRTKYYSCARIAEFRLHSCVKFACAPLLTPTGSRRKLVSSKLFSQTFDTSCTIVCCDNLFVHTFAF